MSDRLMAEPELTLEEYLHGLEELRDQLLAMIVEMEAKENGP